MYTPQKQFVRKIHFSTVDTCHQTPLINQQCGQWMKNKLQQILSMLEQEKYQYLLTHQKEKTQSLLQIKYQKDSKIRNLLEQRDYLRNQNIQLRGKNTQQIQVFKKIENNYKRTINQRNDKISQLSSVVKYLQTKIIQKDKQLTNLQRAEQKQQSKSHKIFAKKQAIPYGTQTKLIMQSLTNSRSHHYNPQCKILYKNQVQKKPFFTDKINQKLSTKQKIEQYGNATNINQVLRENSSGLYYLINRIKLDRIKDINVRKNLSDRY